jgi:glutamate synthase domain-containing protein 2
MSSIRSIRTQAYWTVVGLTLLCVALAPVSLHFLWPLVLTAPLSVLGTWDLLQKEHSLLRNYPLVGHLRFLLEDTGPELRQYIVESNTEGDPFNRDQRSLMYQRAKNVTDKKPFGTEQHVYAAGYLWLSHSMAPKPVCVDPATSLRVLVGEGRCAKPYSASVYNISAMSYGSLSANALLALNEGAKRGGFFHDTGEGGLSRYHREPGGDLVWQIGTGYFGCRDDAGRFDRDLFASKARDDQVKMIELKISQGAKPGHGGILPAAKITPEIAEVRRIPRDRDCVSPAYHTAFDTPVGMLEFISELRELAGGKPVGFKLCVGDPVEFYSVCKAMLETGELPDFIVVDGSEGGTGAAPIEFSDRIGMPAKDALVFVHNTLVGAGLRDRLRVAVAGKVVSAFEMAAAMALGADWCNSARGFMFAVGCIQAQCCHTNQCPSGVATQDPWLQRAIVPARKAERVYHFHRNTVTALAEVIAACGLEHPGELQPHHLWQRVGPDDVLSYDRIYDFYAPGQLIDGDVDPWVREQWDAATPLAFHRAR